MSTMLRMATDRTVVGYGDIAKRLHVDRRTPHQWRARGTMPEPDFIVNRDTNPTPVWYWSTILEWLRETNRTHLLHRQPTDDS